MSRYRFQEPSTSRRSCRIGIGAVALETTQGIPRCSQNIQNFETIPHDAHKYFDGGGFTGTTLCNTCSAPEIISHFCILVRPGSQRYQQKIHPNLCQQVQNAMSTAIAKLSGVPAQFLHRCGLFLCQFSNNQSCSMERSVCKLQVGRHVIPHVAFLVSRKEIIRITVVCQHSAHLWRILQTVEASTCQ